MSDLDARKQKLARVLGLYLIATLVALSVYIFALPQLHAIPIALFVWGLWVIWHVAQAMRGSG